MFGKHFQLNEQTIHIVEEIGRHMPGGFFIYKAELPEELLYANEAVLDIFGCRTLDEFKELTGYTFKGMLHPDDYRAISDSIIKQIANSEDKLDYVEYRIIRKDGAVRWVDDYGHYTDTEAYGCCAWRRVFCLRLVYASKTGIGFVFSDDAGGACRSYE